MREGRTAVSILGLGSIGLRHARNFAKLGARVTAFDPDESRRSLAEAEEIETMVDRAAALHGSDAVVIASPNKFHLYDLQAALETGCHVFVEKPIAHTDEGVDELLDKFKNAEHIVFCGFNLRFHPAVMAAREAILGGHIGDILWARFQMSDYLPDWRPHTDYREGYANDPVSGGVLFDVIHEFDVANTLLGAATTVAASARHTGLLDLQAEDCADVLLRHESGVISALHIDYATRPRRRAYEIAGSKGILSIDLDARSLTMTITSGEQKTEIYPGSYAEDYANEARDFLRCIETGSAPACDGYQALTVLRQVLRARELAGLPSS